MDVVRICSELVKIKSENPPGDTTEVAQYIASLLDGLGIRSDITEGSPGHCNVVSREQNRALTWRRVGIFLRMRGPLTILTYTAAEVRT